MDTYWFAIDARGQVAVFETGENGHTPAGEANDIFDALYRLRFDELDDYEEPEEWARKLGLTFYSYPDHYDGLQWPYQRRVDPDVPLHVDMLPPELRSKCWDDHLDQLCFAQTEFVQPLEFIPCVGYNWENVVAYVAADGVTVRPIPGKGDQFAEFVRVYREWKPTESGRMRFDGPRK
jgi:hypothetical protein